MRSARCAAVQGLSEQCKAVRGNFLEMPFEAATFDGAYAMEATCHAPTLEQVPWGWRQGRRAGGAQCTMQRRGDSGHACAGCKPGGARCQAGFCRAGAGPAPARLGGFERRAGVGGGWVSGWGAA